MVYRTGRGNDNKLSEYLGVYTSAARRLASKSIPTASCSALPSVGRSGGALSRTKARTPPALVARSLLGAERHCRTRPAFVSGSSALGWTISDACDCRDSVPTWVPNAERRWVAASQVRAPLSRCRSPRSVPRRFDSRRGFTHSKRLAAAPARSPSICRYFNDSTIVILGMGNVL